MTRNNLFALSIAVILAAPLLVAQPALAGNGRPDCSDGIDNDGDGLIDFPADTGCSSHNDRDEYNAPPPTYACSDGMDNDGDGRIDMTDPGCSGPTDNSEVDLLYIPRLPTCGRHPFISVCLPGS